MLKVAPQPAGQQAAPPAHDRGSDGRRHLRLGHVRALRHHGEGLRRALHRPDVRHRRGGEVRRPPTRPTSPPPAGRSARSTTASSRPRRSRAWRSRRGRCSASRSSWTRTATRSSPAAPTSAPASPPTRARRGRHLPRGRTPSGATRWHSTRARRRRPGFELGDSVDVVLQDGRRTFTLVAIIGFGETDSLLGATLPASTCPPPSRSGQGRCGRRGRRQGRGRRERAGAARHRRRYSPTVWRR